MRETKEESGIDLINRIPVAYHKLSVGEYFFYEMEGELETSINDTLEIIEARWVPLDDIAHMDCNVDVNNFLRRIDRHGRS